MNSKIKNTTIICCAFIGFIFAYLWYSKSGLFWSIMYLLRESSEKDAFIWPFTVIIYIGGYLAMCFLIYIFRKRNIKLLSLIQKTKVIWDSLLGISLGMFICIIFYANGLNYILNNSMRHEKWNNDTFYNYQNEVIEESIYKKKYEDIINFYKKDGTILYSNSSIGLDRAIINSRKNGKNYLVILKKDHSESSEIEFKFIDIESAEEMCKFVAKSNITVIEEAEKIEDEINAYNKDEFRRFMECHFGFIQDGEISPTYSYYEIIQFSNDIKIIFDKKDICYSDVKAAHVDTKIEKKIKQYLQSSPETNTNDIKETNTEAKQDIQPQSNHTNDLPEWEMQQVWVDCLTCGGSGDCTYCGGNGYDLYGHTDRNFGEIRECVVCHGRKKCQTCAGTKGSYQMQSVRVR